MFSLSFLALVLSNFSIGGITADKPASAAEELTGSTQDTTNLAQRIRRFEDGLLQPNVIKGQPPAKMKLADRMKAYKTPGASIAVINNYKIEWARGYGVRDTETNEPVNLDTLFQAASISKPVTTMAVLRLVQQGKLNLDEDVNKKLVSWKVPENEFTRDKKVTIRGILTHTAGFDVFFYDGTPVGELAPTPLQLLKGVERVVATVDRKVYDDYVGQYQLEISPDYAVAISVEASKLMMEIKQPVGRIKAELLPESKTRFFRTDVDVQVTFVKDERGKVTELIVHQQGAEYRAKRIE